jgi:hypothetical protein
MNCSICGAYLDVDAWTCHDCGAPADHRAASGDGSHCALCEEVLWSLAETCVHCGSKGYPALRPRLGDQSLGAPESGISV